MPNTVKVDVHHITRVEGHGKVTLLQDDNLHIQQARLHIVEFRGFEKFIQGRPYWELPVLVQRLCGICPVSHHLAAAKTVDRLVGGENLTPTAEKMPNQISTPIIVPARAFVLAALNVSASALRATNISTAPLPARQPAVISSRMMIQSMTPTMIGERTAGMMLSG